MRSARTAFACALVLVVALAPGCRGGDAPPTVMLTASDLPGLAPADHEVRTILGVDALEGEPREALTQALEGVAPADLAALETHGRGYSAGDPNSGGPWTAAGVLLALADDTQVAERVFNTISSGPAWQPAEGDGASELAARGAARRMPISRQDGFTGEILLVRADRLLVHIVVAGSQDEPRVDDARAIADAVFARLDRCPRRRRRAGDRASPRW